MLSEQLIIYINVACITFLVIMLAILILSTRLKHGAGYVAVATIATTVPVYFSNLMRTLDSGGFEMSLYIGCFLNVLCIPMLWFYVHLLLDDKFRIRPRTLLHVLPAFVSLAVTLIYYLPLDAGQVSAERDFLEAGNENLPALVNDVILFGQLFIYFPLMIIFIRKRKPYIQENYSDGEYLQRLNWLPQFIWAFFFLFIVVFVAYVISPRSDVWLIPILNTIGISYLTSMVIRNSSSVQTVQTAGTVTEPVDNPSASTVSTLDEEEMKKVCERATEYAVSSKAYLRHDLNLAFFAHEIGVPQRTLSRSINSYLGLNFFDFINNMRVEEVKKKLIASDSGKYSIDGIYSECGFRSRSTFFLVFKKLVGKSPAAWLEEERERR